jgi:anthranilate synthase component II
MQILLIDNYDSFTYNLYDYLSQLGAVCRLVRNDETDLKTLCQYAEQADALVLSPGPKRPENAGLLMQLVAEIWNKKPILGVCLGHQALCEYFGARLCYAKQQMHGKTSYLQHNQKGIFEHLSEQLQVMRYHSLIIEDLPECLEATAYSLDTQELMAFQHKNLPLVGVQFHPESIESPEGLKMLSNWLKMVKIGLKNSQKLEKNV